MTAIAPIAVDAPPDPDLARIRDVIYQVAGIFHPDNKLQLLFDRCSRRMKQLQAPTLHDYLAHLTLQPDRQTEIEALLNEITIGETCFFRHRTQLEALRRVILPRVLAAKTTLPPRKLRIWSAGCSTGEEPYTLSMVLLEEQRERLQDCTVEIVATDINERSLAQANAALYGSHSTRHLTPYYRQKHFLPAGDQLRLQLSARSCVTFRRLNLFDDAGMNLMYGFDVVFCCNVLIYFNLASKRRVLQHFHRSLLPHGYLILSPAESLFDVSEDFSLIHFPGATGYLKGQRKPASPSGAI